MDVEETVAFAGSYGLAGLLPWLGKLVLLLGCLFPFSIFCRLHALVIVETDPTRATLVCCFGASS